MWWECENCGGVVEMSKAPAVCEECGTAGPSLAGHGAPASRHAPFETLRDEWIRAGLHAKRGRDAAHAR
jgi:ABC-type ATPase with predicted acetyltransferase domain